MGEASDWCVCCDVSKDGGRDKVCFGFITVYG